MEANLQMLPAQHCPPLTYFWFVHSKTLLFCTMLWVELWQMKKDEEPLPSKNEQPNWETEKGRGDAESGRKSSAWRVLVPQGKADLRSPSPETPPRAGVYLQLGRWQRKPTCFGDFHSFPFCPHTAITILRTIIFITKSIKLKQNKWCHW